jgi:biotin synthase-related radical SAM superfamily protein
MGAAPDVADMAPETPVLTATCPSCGEPFPSAIQFDPDRWFDVSLHKGMVERCPGCRASSMFMKRDYYFCID